MKLEQVRITVNFGNAAMQDDRDFANALRELARRIDEGQEPCKVMDLNGNGVGEVEYNPTNPVSVLYVADGRIFTIGPFDDSDDATAAAKSAQAEGEFDIRDQYVYLLEDGKVSELSCSDLDVE